MFTDIVKISNLNLKYGPKAILRDLNWTITAGNNYLLSGESGSGKTTLAKIIAGQLTAAGEVKFQFNPSSTLPQQVVYIESWYQFKNIEGVANFYYQQRYTSLQTKDILTVHAELLAYGKENNLAFDGVEPLLEALDFTAFASSKLIELSSGEHKKLQLIKALWLQPQLLIIDQPYTGLDKSSRENLNTLLNRAVNNGLQLMLISNGNEYPSCINSFVHLADGQVFALDKPKIIEPITALSTNDLPDFLKVAPIYHSEEMVKMVDIQIRYGEKQILKNINWEVKAGEKWLLQGHNGSGKSTLLSLINGDHPQSYANELYLFGKRRGSGESVWDIKQHIGLISPEFHWYFDATATVWQSIASGFYDTIGLFQQLNYSKSVQVDELIAFFGLTEQKNSILNTLPLGKQRIVLLARTIIKNPELLILDEPCQGLDEEQTQHFNQLVDVLCHNGMTLIYVGHFATAYPNSIEKRILLEKGEVKSVDMILERI